MEAKAIFTSMVGSTGQQFQENHLISWSRAID